MGWSKVSERRWERPVSGLESYFIVTGVASAALCEGRQHYTIFSKLKVEIDAVDVESALKHAWKQLRHEQPQIATTIEGTNKVYEVPDEAALQEWLASTFIVSPASDAEELYASTAPINQATLYYVPKSSELLIRAHHYTLDGVGMLLLCHSYLSALAAPVKDLKFGDEYTRLVPTVEEVLGHTGPLTPEQTAKATADFGGWMASIPGIGPVSKVGTVPAGKCQNTELVFPTRTTEAIINRCKNKGISVTSAVHAAYVQAIVRNADPSCTKDHYANANQFNYRPYLPAPYNTSQYAASVFYTPYPYKLDLPASYEETAQALNTHYKTLIKNDPEILVRHGDFTTMLSNAIQTPEFQAHPISRDALVSSLGIAEQYLQRTYGRSITVRDIKTGVDVVLGMSMLFIYTFHDQLRLLYCFNDGYEEASNIDTYLEDLKRILVEELLA
ncbi:hypothetical protein BO70DRAFT_363370 [Aspergillus heteromorphus CBS 117.55]|uniref:Condensation domain-containing protein n=1 Tax=Aspergillus heteromorphus CBS 117.55 TaxID=1448321 RepID=A0A317VX16_9EURO|nr:uncharacterized protein BO70DRAFT_363370 [Aspergillus heteromorphus CBS 117.55]PWY77438.1 hypothetical protein BO70DRAFT_363370 [Aspergillus heteromorphus CBS 117.55]